MYNNIDLTVHLFQLEYVNQLHNVQTVLEKSEKLGF